MPSVNKVVAGGQTLIDLSQDTLTSPSQIANGVTAHNAAGEQITGIFIPPTGDISITENGSYEVGQYATATVDVQGSIPSNLEYGVDYPLSSGQCTHYHLNEEAVDIENYAFYNASGLIGPAKNITTFDNLNKKTSIGRYAFCNCTSLTSADYSSATSIGDYAFRGCTSLTSADCSSATSIGDYAFLNCTSLTSADYSSATSIGYAAFRGCTSLTSADCSSATSIEDCAFYGCDSLTNADCSSATSIGSSAFQECTSLTNIDISSAKSIGSYAFYGCTSLTSADCSSATSIGSYAFYGCTSLTSADCSSATSIGSSAFNSCTNLTSIIIKNGVFYSTYQSALNKIFSFNNHLYWQNGTTTNKIYRSDAVAGSPTTTLIGTLTSSNPSFTYTDGDRTFTFARTGTDNNFSVSWTETP